jgi:hypothetical protein
MPLLSVIIPVWNEALLGTGAVASAGVISFQPTEKISKRFHRCRSTRCYTELRGQEWRRFRRGSAHVVTESDRYRQIKEQTWQAIKTQAGSVLSR